MASDRNDKKRPRSLEVNDASFDALMSVYNELHPRLAPLLYEHNQLDYRFNFKLSCEQINESAYDQIKLFSPKEPLALFFFEKMKLVYKISSFISVLDQFSKDADIYLDTLEEKYDDETVQKKFDEILEIRNWVAKCINLVDFNMRRCVNVYNRLPNTHFFKHDILKLFEGYPAVLAWISPYLDENCEDPLMAAVQTLPPSNQKHRVLKKQTNDTEQADTHAYMQAKRKEYFRKNIIPPIRKIQEKYSDLFDEFACYDENYWFNLMSSFEHSYATTIQQVCVYVFKLKPVRELILEFQDHLDILRDFSTQIDSEESKVKIRAIFFELEEMRDSLMQIVNDIADLREYLVRNYSQQKANLEPELADFMEIWSKNQKTLDVTSEAIEFIERNEKLSTLCPKFKASR